MTSTPLLLLSTAAAAAASQLASSPLLGGGLPQVPQHEREQQQQQPVLGPQPPQPRGPPPPGFTAADWVLLSLVLLATAAAGVFHGCLRLAAGAGGGGVPSGLLAINRRGAVTDLAFLFVCYNSFLVVMGLPCHAYYHGLSALLWTGPPAAVAAAVAALLLVLPVFSADGSPFAAASPAASPATAGAGAAKYLRFRFDSRAVEGLAKILAAFTWATVTAASISGLASLLHGAVASDSFSHSASLVIVVAAAVVFVAFEGKSSLLWSDFVLAAILCVSLVVASAVALSGADDLSVGNQGFAMRRQQFPSEMGMMDRVSQRPLAPEESPVVLFFGQFFVWMCAYTAFYTSDARLASLQSDSSTPLLLFLQLPPLAAAFAAVSLLSLAMSATVPLLANAPSTPSSPAETTVTALVDCDTKEASSTTPDDLIGRFFLQRIGAHHALPGFPGLIVAAVFALTLSTLSTGSNYLVEQFLLAMKKGSSSALRESLNENGHLQRSASSRHNPPPQLQQQQPQQQLLSSTQQLRQRVLAALLTLLAGAGAVLLRDASAYAAAVTVGSAAAGALMGVLFLGLFFPYANARGAVLGSVLSLAACYWLSAGGLWAADAALGLAPVRHAAQRLCANNLTSPGLSASPGSFMPTGLQAAGKIVTGSTSGVNGGDQRSAPGFVLIPSIKQGDPHHQDQQSQPEGADGETFLPRSPVFNGQTAASASDAKKNPWRRRRRRRRRWALASSTNNVSPHQQRQQNRGSGDSKGPASPFASGGGISQGGGVTRHQLQQQQQSGQSNKPPLVFSNQGGDFSAPGANSGFGSGGPSAPTGAGRNRERGGSGGGGSLVHNGPVEKSEAGQTQGIFQHISYHLYGLLSMACTIVLGLLCSLRPSPRTECVSVAVDELEADEVAAGTNGASSTANPAAVRVKKSRVVMLDPRLLHPAARKIWCNCCSERRDRGGGGLSFSMEKHRGQLVHVTSIEDPAGGARHNSMTSQQQQQQRELLLQDPTLHHYRQGSVISRQSIALNGNQNGDGLIRRCSRHSQHSKRSSLGSGHGAAATGTTQVDVMVGAAGVAAGVSPGASPRAMTAHSSSITAAAVAAATAAAAEQQQQHLGVERRLSQLSDQEQVETVVQKAMEQVSRRSSNSSAQQQRQRISPQMSLSVPAAAAMLVAGQPPPASPHNRLAPPSELEAQAQRRFSEHAAAVERHNSRRAAKRSKSVMYRGGAAGARRPLRRNSTDVQDFDPFSHTSRQPQQHLPPPPPQMMPPPQEMMAPPQEMAMRLAPPLQATLSAPSPSRRSSSLRKRPQM